jgi:hypothetical protein
MKVIKIQLKIIYNDKKKWGFEMFKMLEVEKNHCNDRREAGKRKNEVTKELKATMKKI